MRTLQSCGLFPCLVLVAACSHRQEEPVPPPSAPESASAATPSGRLLRKDARDAAIIDLPQASREPDWGLDPRDPAKDYVTRYVRGSRRYGDQTACVVVGASVVKDQKSLVEVKNDASGKCGPAGQLRDRFIVSVTDDRLALDPSLHQPALQHWPDGSDPGAPPGPIADQQDVRHWKGELHEAFHAILLAPLRVQLYGRGTYPVITIAGWHGPVMRDFTPAQLEAPARKLCEANGGEPLGVVTALDRSVVFRVNCPASGRFEKL